MTTLPRGTKGFCLACGDHLITFCNEIKPGQSINEGDIDQTQGQAPWKFQDRCICKKCGAYFSFNHVIRWEIPK